MLLLKLFPTPVAIIKFTSLSPEEEFFLLNTSTGNYNHKYLENIGSNDSYILNNIKLNSLKNKIQDSINLYKKEVMCCDQEMYITNSWVNFLEPGKRHSMHHHSNSMLSGVYFINVNNETPNLQLEHPNTKLWPLSWERKNDKYENNLGELIIAEKNMLVLFPSTIWHSVDINTSSITRVSLSFNTFLKGDVKQKFYISDLKLK